MSIPRVAIVGMAGRFPRARDLREFWQNLDAGVHGISFFSDAELLGRGVSAASLQSADFVKAGGVLEDAASFDAQLFGYSPRDAELLDPQHRIFLECAWEGLEDAGYPPGELKLRAGVFASCGLDTYLMANLATNPELLARVGMDQVRIANRLDNLATRVSYKLNLTGPSLAVQTGCSSSLVAVHLACQSLLSGECDIALAGGVRFSVARDRGYRYVPGGVVSPDGCCRTFDARAQGMVGGDGAGVVVLRRESDARRDGDCLRALILGSAVNNDGNRKVGYTAPSPRGQAQVIREALAIASAAPDSISHVEAHGTATTLGDPIEVAALKEVFAANGADRRPLAISSVKTSIGHLDAASGVAGLIKCVLELEHRRLAPNLHFERASPALELEGSRLWVVQHATDWPCTGGPRRAGISSFGIGGTNAHVVVEEAPPRESSTAHGPHLLLFSAASDTSLDRQIERMADWVSAHPADELADAALTLAVGRKSLPRRAFAVCVDREQAVRRLYARDVERNDGDCRRRAVVFLFPGQGSQRARLSEQLYRREPVFRRAFDECAERLRPHMGGDLRTVVFGCGASDTALDATDLAQPALFAVSWSVATLLMSWGVSPAALAGHSLGELVAACLANVFSLDDALRVVAARGRLMASMPPGGMSSVALPPSQVVPILPETLSIAAVNAPDLCTVAGPLDALSAWEEARRREGVVSRRLPTRHAFHSPAVAGVVAAFRDVVSTVERRPPQLPLISNLTGTWLTADEAMDADYWARQMCQPVRFADGVERLWSLRDPLFVEVGPGDALSTFVRRSRSRIAGTRIVATLGRRGDELGEHAAVVEAAARLWGSGVPVDWSTVATTWNGRRVTLPTYSFERRRFYIEAKSTTTGATDANDPLPPEDWLHVPSWQRLPGGGSSAPVAARSWALVGATSFLEPLAEALRARGQRAWLAPGVRDLEALVARGTTSDAVVYVIDTEAPESGSVPRACIELLELARVAAQTRQLDSLYVLSPCAAHSVTGDEAIMPASAAVAGLLKVIPQEYAHLDWQFIDAADEDDFARRMVDELLGTSGGPLVARRGSRRWTPRYEPMRCGTTGVPAPGSVWIVTGGTGRIGLAIARRWTKRGVRLVLTSRTPPAPGSEAARTFEDVAGQGGVAVHVAADATDAVAMRMAFELAEARFGRVDGVIHAAGLTRVTRDLASLDAAACDAYFRPKLAGARVLAALLRTRQVPVCVLMSSLSSILGGLGYGAHAAANAALDAFAERMNGTSPSRWISINWDGWHFGDPGGAATLISAAAGVDVLERILGLGESQVLVSVTDLDARLRNWVRREPTVRVTGESPSEAAPFAVGSAGVKGRSEAERRIVAIWEDLLGARDVGVDDDFFALGGHSLLATRIAARLREQFDVTLSARVVLENPTVARLATAVTAAVAADIAALTDAEVHSLLRGTDSHA